MALQTFPGVYTKVIDQSFIPQVTSRFRCGLIGVAEKGSFDALIPVTSVKDYVRNLGQEVSGTFMAQTAAILAAMSDGLTCVRVGRRYHDSVSAVSGSAGASTVRTPSANLFSVNDFCRITQTGKASTCNAKIESIDLGTNTITFVSTGTEAQTLADNYTAGVMDKCAVVNAANEAECFVSYYTYGSAIQYSAVNLLAAGDKNSYEIQVSNAPTTQAAMLALIAPGDLLKLEQANKSTTREIMVKEVFPASGVTPARITFETSAIVESGYQALSLQDSYTGATLKKVASSGGVYTKTRSIHILASSAGTWANSDGLKTGIQVRIGPGNKPDTKKFTVYWNSAQVEIIDNLSFDSSSADYVETRINGKSAYIVCSVLYNAEPAANSLDGWNNAINPTNTAYMTNGFNGENVTASDFIGTVNPADDSATGLKIFEDTNAIQVDIISCPGRSDVSIAQEAIRIGQEVNSVYVMDAPAGLNAREATDWHNGTGLYTGNGKIDSSYVACFYNWIDMADAFTGATILAPPVVGALRCLANTFDKWKPWFAAAGEQRGLIPEATGLEYERIVQDSLDGMYGNGNCLNPIMVNRGRIMVFGDRTMQRAESKLSALHSMILVNYIMRGLSDIGRQYVFDPNDNVLLSQIYAAFSQYLKGILNERGLETFSLTVDGSNNTAATRNAREVIVDLSIVPTDVAERIFINATVRESGATLNQIS